MRLTEAQRNSLRMLFGGRCAYCGCELPQKGWHADHVEAVHREWWKRSKRWQESHKFKWVFNDTTGALEKQEQELDCSVGLERPENDTIDNLFPSCRACNIDKHASSLEDWRMQMQRRVEVCRNNYSAFRHAERFGLVQEIKKPVVFWFEQYRLDGE